MNVYVVIVTYNPKKWIVNCLESLKKSEIHLNTIIIDNCSTDGSQDFINENYSEIDFVESGENLGFGKANNIGIKKAYDEGADYIFLLNHDAWIEPNTIGNLIKCANKHPEYGVISPMHLNGRGSALDYNFSNYIIPTKCKNLYSDIFTNSLNDLYEVQFVNAAAWLITRNCIEIVGGFNPSFYHYSEDNNYCQRVLFHNIKVGIAPFSKIYHDRQNRKINSYFDDEGISYKRNIILTFSNPNNNLTRNDFYKAEIKNFVQSIVFLKNKSLIKIIKNLTYIKSINFEILLQNRQKSKSKGLSFLHPNN